jgi:hypothetical protein
MRHIYRNENQNLFQASSGAAYSGEEFQKLSLLTELGCEGNFSTRISHLWRWQEARS